MSRTSKCRLARAWASWVAWSAMNKPLEPALKRIRAARLRPVVVNSFLTNVFLLRGSRSGGVGAYAYAPRGVGLRPGLRPAAALRVQWQSVAGADVELYGRGHRLVRCHNSPRPRGPAHP